MVLFLLTPIFAKAEALTTDHIHFLQNHPDLIDVPSFSDLELKENRVRLVQPNALILQTSPTPLWTHRAIYIQETDVDEYYFSPDVPGAALVVMDPTANPGFGKTADSIHFSEVREENRLIRNYSDAHIVSEYTFSTQCDQPNAPYPASATLTIRAFDINVLRIVGFDDDAYYRSALK